MGQARPCQCCSTLSPLRVFDADAAQSVRPPPVRPSRSSRDQQRSAIRPEPTLGAGTKWQNLSTTASVETRLWIEIRLPTLDKKHLSNRSSVHSVARDDRRSRMTLLKCRRIPIEI